MEVLFYSSADKGVPWSAATHFIITDALINDAGQPQVTRMNIIIVTLQLNHFLRSFCSAQNVNSQEI